MASIKDYVYQIKGNKLSLLEKDFTTTDGLNYTFSGVSGDGITDGVTTGSTILKSPISAVADGIEIEYAYSPKYQLPVLHPYVNQFGIVGWTIVDGYLTFLSSTINWTSSPHTAIAADEYIYIGNSSRWTGIHKVQEVQASTGTHGGVKTYTKVNQSIKYFTDSSVTFGTAEAIQDLDENFDDVFTSSSAVPYIWITGSDGGGHNNGFFSDWSFSGTILDASSSTFHYYNDAGQLDILSATPTFLADATNVIYIREAFYDPSYIVSDIDILSDESDTIDLSPYLSKALVYYVKAKLAEDAMEIEAKEYLMREFKRMVEKQASSNVTGPRTVLAGRNSIR